MVWLSDIYVFFIQNRDESKPKEKRKRKSRKEREEVTKPKKLKVTGEVSGLGSQLQPMFLSKRVLSFNDKY